MSSDYQIDWQDETAVFTIVRPQKLNAITAAVLDGLTTVLDDLEAGKGRALIITGTGEKAFCAGTDLAESAALDQQSADAKTLRARALFARLYHSSISSIAAINGLAYGGGLELAMACTLRIAQPHARLSLPEVKLAVIPAYGGTQMLPALVGRGRALDMMLTGRAVTTDEALTMGLINRIAQADMPLLEQAQAFLGEITCHSQVAIDAIRECVAVASDAVTEAGLAAEDTAMRRAQSSADAVEGVTAFLEKRPPVFSHR
jgi:enoyl-CoA hydratase